VFGTAVHVVLKTGAGDSGGALRERLDAAGMQVTSIASVQPSLEDVFLELVEQAG
jgi:hypothetical protein